jgi:site-specific DNA-methyltransferase (adenine-specific)
MTGQSTAAPVAPYYQDDLVTLYHGDCLQVTEWLAADVLVTDPPYGMAYVSGYAQTRRPIRGDQDQDLRNEVLALWGAKPALVFGTWRVPRPTSVRQLITWHKQSVGPGMGDLALPWGNATEEIYVLGDGWRGHRRPNLISTSEQRGGTVGVAALLGHPTPKPVGLMEQLIACAPPGVIADPFAGVGATLIAARNLGRRSIGVEIEERYCEITARRLAQDVLNFGETA